MSRQKQRRRYPVKSDFVRLAILLVGRATWTWLRPWYRSDVEMAAALWESEPAEIASIRESHRQAVAVRAEIAALLRSHVRVVEGG